MKNCLKLFLLVFKHVKDALVGRRPTNIESTLSNMEPLSRSMLRTSPKKRNKPSRCESKKCTPQKHIDKSLKQKSCGTVAVFFLMVTLHGHPAPQKTKKKTAPKSLSQSPRCCRAVAALEVSKMKRSCWDTWPTTTAAPRSTTCLGQL